MSESSPTDDLIDDTSNEDTASPSSAEDKGVEPESMFDAVADSVGSEFEADGDLIVEDELASLQAETEDNPDPQKDSSEPQAEPDPSEKAQEDTEEDKSSGDEDELPDEPDEAELDGYKPKTRRRIEKLLSERNELRRQSAEYAPFVEAMTNHDVSRDDMALLLGAGAALRRGDFEAFLAGVQPYVDRAQAMLGQRLTPDLQEQVNQGYITADAARELAQRRAHGEHIQGEADRTKERTEKQALEDHAVNVRRTISEWETATRERDPDYAIKQDAVRRHAQALIQERGIPQTTEQAVEYAEEAYREVTKLTEAARPQPRSTRLTPNGAQSSNAHGARSEPTSLYDAAMRGLAAAQGS